MKLKGGYSSSDCPVNRSHSIKYLPTRQCSSAWIGFLMLYRSSRTRLIGIQTTHPRSNRNPRQSPRLSRTRWNRRRPSLWYSRRPSRSKRPCEQIFRRYPRRLKHRRHRLYSSPLQAYKDHDWTEGRDNSARNKGSASGASGRYGAGAIQGRIDICKNILDGFEVTPVNVVI